MKEITTTEEVELQRLFSRGRFPNGQVINYGENLSRGQCGKRGLCLDCLVKKVS